MDGWGEEVPVAPPGAVAELGASGVAGIRLLKPMRELPIPPDATGTKDAAELIRGWIIDGGLQCSLLPTIWADQPETWGMLLADIAQHVSDVVSAQGHFSKQQILSGIVNRFTSEISEPTAEREGHFLERPNGQTTGSA
jgi:hypothetical protein